MSAKIVQILTQFIVIERRVGLSYKIHFEQRFLIRVSPW